MVAALFDQEGNRVEQLSAGQQGIVVLEKTAFYAESGGQVGDTGTLEWDRGVFAVADCTKEAKTWLHHGAVSEGVLKVGDQVAGHVDLERRHAISRNHSATHLMHAALRIVLGDHCHQKGSLVNEEHLRFDFSHFEAVTADEIARIEDIVNQQILANTPVLTEILPIEEAKAKGAAALFGEKYEDIVRVLTMGHGYSVELCGGIHAERTGDLGLFRIKSESGIASGVRRIEAVTGMGALNWSRESDNALSNIAEVVKGNRETVVERVQSLSEKGRQLEKEVERLKAKLATSQSADLAGQAVDVSGVKVLAVELEGVEPKALRDMVDQLKNKLGRSVVVVATVQDDKVSVAAGVAKELTGQVKAGDIVKELATRLGGKGGGRPDMAQGGGTDVAALPAALQAVPEMVAAAL